MGDKNGPFGYLNNLLGNLGTSNTLIGLGALGIKQGNIDVLQPQTGVIQHNNPALNVVNVGSVNEPSKVLIHTSRAAVLAGKFTVLGGIGIEVVQGAHNISNGAVPRTEILKTTLDIEMGLITGFWPIGTGVGVTYFLIDSYVGWDSF